MKKDFYSLVLFLFFVPVFSFAQKVVDTILVSFPNISNTKGSRLINWDFGNDKKNIYLYEAGHVKGSFFVASESELADAKANYKKKTFLGKLATNILADNLREEIALPVILEKSFSVADKLNPSSQIYKGFHLFDSLEAEKNAYFKREESIADLDASAFDGEKLIYSYKDLNKAFSYTPKYNSPDKPFYAADNQALFFGYKPVATLKRKNFIFKGLYTSQTATENLFEFRKDPELKDLKVINNSFLCVEDKFLLHFEKPKNDTSYVFAFYDAKENKSRNIVVSFENSRNAIVENTLLYDENFVPVGFATLYGYDKKQSKSLKQYPKNAFDLVLVDKNGALTKTGFLFGDGENKVSFTPHFFILNKDKTISIVGRHLESSKNDFLEKITIDPVSGVAKTIYKENYYTTSKSGANINSANFLENIKIIEPFGNNQFAVISPSVERKGENVPVQMGNTTTTIFQDVFYTNGVNVLMLDKELKPIDYFTLTRDVKNSKDSFDYQLINKTIDQLQWVLRRNNEFYLLSLNTSGTPQFEKILSPYTEKASPYMSFLYSEAKPVLIDKDNKTGYLLHQFYEKAGEFLYLKKAGITKFVF